MKISRRVKQILIVWFVCIFLAFCTYQDDKSQTSKEPKQSNVKLDGFSKKELYTELLARSYKADKNLATDTVPLDDRLREYSNKSLYDVIYNIDDRKNIYEIGDTALLNDSKKAACLMMKDQLDKNSDGTFSIKTTGIYKTLYGLCDSENFSDEPVAAFCSGFAINKNIFVTAGHCIEGADISKIVIVYGYAVNKADNINLIIQQSNIFQFDSIIAMPPDKHTKDDYCLLRIKREFPSERIVKIRMDGKISDNENLHVIGYPCGLPLKVTSNGRVYKNGIPNYFVTNLDTYHGNSGSPVFNSKTHIVEGILVRGNQDFPTISIEGCKRSLICPETVGNCDGEDVSRTSQFCQWIK